MIPAPNIKRGKHIMESTVQAGKTRLQTLIDLSNQLSACEADAAAADLMAGDLTDFFEEANNLEPADRILTAFYTPENVIRAHILQEYTNRAKTGLKNLYEQTHGLIDTMRQEGA